MKNVTIVGIGALGSHCVLLLRNVDASIKIVDHDKVSAANTQSQFHGKPNVSKSKVNSLAKTMRLLFGADCNVDYEVPHKLVKDNVDALLKESNLILDAVDNGETRRLIQNYARQHGIPCLHGALAANGQYGRVVWDERFQIDDEASAGQATCEDGQHLPFIALVSAYLARAAQEFLVTGRKIGFEVNPTGAFTT